MAKLLLNLYRVPDDEADEVRALLDEHAIEYYETAPNRWGISHGGIWVTHDADVAGAKALFATYQVQRAEHARQAWADARRDGTATSFWSLMRAHPGYVFLVLAGIACALGLVALPALLLG